jgi:hypothetical protein
MTRKSRKGLFTSSSNIGRRVFPKYRKVLSIQALGFSGFAFREMTGIEAKALQKSA